MRAARLPDDPDQQVVGTGIQAGADFDQRVDTGDGRFVVPTRAGTPRTHMVGVWGQLRTKGLSPLCKAKWLWLAKPGFWPPLLRVISATGPTHFGADLPANSAVSPAVKGASAPDPEGVDGRGGGA